MDDCFEKNEMHQGTVPEPLADNPLLGGLIALPWHVLDRPLYLIAPCYLMDVVFGSFLP